tara:strand:+ start:1197 stop:2600 length:1404 start_codon:yes stop_codon:yes gene_type:complete
MESLNKYDIRKFLSFEEEYKLNEIRYKGEKIWPIIRYAVYDGILEHQEKAQRAVSSQEISKRPSIFKKLIKLIISLRSLKSLFGQTDILLYNYGRVLDFDGMKDNLLVWTFSEALKENYSITVVDQYGIYPPQKCEVINISEMLSMLGFIASFFTRFTQWPQFEKEVNEKIKGFYDFEIDLRKIYVSNFLYQKLIGKLTDKIIEIKKPKALIYSDTGSFSEIIRNAKSKKVLTIDYQHALQSGQNLLYTHNPVIVNEYTEFLSDYVFTFGKYWDEYFEENYKVISVGSRYQELMVTKTKNIQKEENSIVFISDGEMARKEFERLAMSIAIDMPEIQIYYRLRPDEFLNWKSLYSKEIRNIKNISFIDNNISSLHNTLKKSNYVIGINSTALIEAMPLSNVIIHKKGWYIEMEQFIKKDVVLTSRNSEDIINIIKENKIAKNSLEGIEIFKSNADKNISNSIRDLLYS